MLICVWLLLICVLNFVPSKFLSWSHNPHWRPYKKREEHQGCLSTEERPGEHTAGRRDQVSTLREDSVCQPGGVLSAGLMIAFASNVLEPTYLGSLFHWASTFPLASFNWHSLIFPLTFVIVTWEDCRPVLIGCVLMIRFRFYMFRW